ncbi:MAG: metallophosphoesterase [Bacteroidaceae bacterium]|nr:metallophosphoesterase [Bacteroidaceae bacterium]
MIHRIFILLLLLMWLPDVFIFRRFIKPSNSFLRKCKWIYWVPTMVLTLTLLIMLTGDNFTTFRVNLTSIYMITYLTIVVPKCLFVLFSLLGSLLTLFRHLPLIGKIFTWPILPIFNIVGLLIAFAGAYIILYGFIYGWRRFEIKEISFIHPDVPEAFDGYRIVQISDFHMGTIAHYPNDIRRAVEMINAQHPDMIAFTGDLVNNEAIELDGVEEILAELKARDGVFSVLGNHDYAPYRHWPSKRAQAENLADLKRREVTMGWQLLLNENRLIKRGNDSIAIVGVENDGKPPFPSMGDLPRATRGTEGLFKLLLSHDPSHWRRKVLPNTDIQLTLSGHTHAMQFCIGGFSPSTWIYPEWGGLYTEKGRGLYVNMGIGSVMIPYRFGAWPEISVITLRKKTEN